MMVDPAELVSAFDIADRLGVVPSAVSNWRWRHANFPEPVAVVGRERTALWLWPAVEAWSHIPRPLGRRPAAPVERTDAEGRQRDD